MSRERITIAGDSVVVRLPEEILDALGFAVGDEVEISVIDRALIVRSIDEAERAERVENAAADIFERRQSAYEELAK